MHMNVLYALRHRARAPGAGDRAVPPMSGASRSPRPSIRRSVGHRVIAVGQRIAAEPSLELARSR